MKKFLRALLVILILSAAIYLLNAYYDNILTQKLEEVFQPSTETTVQVTSNENKNMPSIAEQVYNDLTESEQEAFDKIYNALLKRRESTTVPKDIEADRLFELAELVTSQHPEIFWWDGSCSISRGGMKFDYTYSREEIEEINAQIKAKTNEILTQINPQGSDFDKSLAIFDYIILNATYNDAAIDNMDKYPRAATIEGVLLDGTAVCSGYSKAYQYLLKAVGVDCVYVTGYADTPEGDEAHAWVLQEVDGYYYPTDATWGDSYEEEDAKDFVSHTYFCTTSGELAKTHTGNSEFYRFFATKDMCNSYFVKKNLQFKEYNYNDIKTALKREFQTNKVAFEIKFTSAEEYQKAIKALLDNGQIHTILMSVDLFCKYIDPYSISFNTDDTHNIITIVYKKTN